MSWVRRVYKLIFFNVTQDAVSPTFDVPQVPLVEEEAVGNARQSPQKGSYAGSLR